MPTDASADWNTVSSAKGVDARPYGTAVGAFEAHVVRRNVAWLTADPQISSVNFTPLHELDGVITPNGLCFERHHSRHRRGRIRPSTSG